MWFTTWSENKERNHKVISAFAEYHSTFDQIRQTHFIKAFSHLGLERNFHDLIKSIFKKKKNLPQVVIWNGEEFQMAKKIFSWKWEQDKDFTVTSSIHHVIGETV